MRFLTFLLCLMALTASPTSQQNSKKSPKIRLTLLVFQGCPNSPKMQHNLDEALKKLKFPARYEIVDLFRLPKGDPRTGYAAPTILINGKDLFGLPRPWASDNRACRIYPGGVPSANDIASRIRG